METETKMKTARPRLLNNAFGQGSILVRRPRNLRLLSELPADLPTKLFARAKLVRLAAGKVLCRAGAPGDGLGVARQGFLSVKAGRPIRPNANVPGNWCLSGYGIGV